MNILRHGKKWVLEAHGIKNHNDLKCPECECGNVDTEDFNWVNRSDDNTRETTYILKLSCNNCKCIFSYERKEYNKKEKWII